MEEGLTRQLADDLELGFERLVRSRQNRVFAFALALTHDRGEAEEIAQEAFVRAYRALAVYPRDRILELRLDGWLHRIALNLVRNQRRRPRPAVMVLEDFVADAGAGPAELFESTELLLRLGAMVAALPLPQREAVVLRCVQGLRYSELAELLEQPLGTVKSNVHRGLEALRRRLASEVTA